MQVQIFITRKTFGLSDEILFEFQRIIFKFPRSREQFKITLSCVQIKKGLDESIVTSSSYIQSILILIGYIQSSLRDVYFVCVLLWVLKPRVRVRKTRGKAFRVCNKRASARNFAELREIRANPAPPRHNLKAACVLGAKPAAHA